MGTYRHLPTPAREGGLNEYLIAIRKYPILTAEEEYTLGKKFADDGDVASAHKLVTSHLRLAAKIALEYRGYGLPVADLVSEANVGLMHAVKRFDPERGFRLATYALWWIRAQVQEFVLRSWSLVKLGTTSSQKKLFFNLRKVMERIGIVDGSLPNPQQIEEIAKVLNVKERDVVHMVGRLSGQDSSLNVPVSFEDNSSVERQDLLVDSSADHAEEYAEEEETRFRRGLLQEALATLQERERDIFVRRKLDEPSLTLETLAQKYGVSRERIRQIESRAMEKVSVKLRQLEKERRAGS